jgi:hypothetical protein
MKSKWFLLGFAGIVLAIVFSGCVSVPIQDPVPNGSQSVVTVRRAESDVNKKKLLLLYIDGRVEKNVLNGGKGSVLVMNGLHNVQVEINKDKSQMLTFDGNSEVVEFYANYEGSGRSRQLNLVKTSGGNTRAANTTAAPVINIQVDNSSSNTAAGGNSSGNSLSTTTNTNSNNDNSVRD